MPQVEVADKIHRVRPRSRVQVVQPAPTVEPRGVTRAEKAHIATTRQTPGASAARREGAEEDRRTLGLRHPDPGCLSVAGTEGTESSPLVVSSQGTRPLTAAADAVGSGTAGPGQPLALVAGDATAPIRIGVGEPTRAVVESAEEAPQRMVGGDLQETGDPEW